MIWPIAGAKHANIIFFGHMTCIIAGVAIAGVVLARLQIHETTLPPGTQERFAARPKVGDAIS